MGKAARIALPKTRRAIFFLLLGIAATIAVISWFVLSRDRANDVVVEAVEQSSQDLSSVLSQVDVAKLNRRKLAFGKKTAELSGPFPSVPKSRQGLLLESDPFGATSASEQAWLDRNGYPNQKQWEAYSQASDAQLQQAADIGDSVANVMLNYRRLAAGDMTAQEDLLASAVEGSGFALDMYASFMAGSKSHGSTETAYILTKVAEMRGNYVHGLTRDSMLSVVPSQAQELQWNARSIQLFGELQKLHQEVNGGGAWVDSRPMKLSSELSGLTFSGEWQSHLAEPNRTD
jgi:hypothetical protein